MTRKKLRQIRGLMQEIIEHEERVAKLAAYSLFDPDEEERTIERMRSEVREIEAFVRQIGDSQTRRAFRLRYIDGLSWSAVSAKLGYGDESGARQLCRRYLDHMG